MPNRLRNLAGELAKLNVQIRHSLELAEAKVSRISELIAELANRGLMSRAVLLGKIREIPVDPDAPPRDGLRVIQAVLLAPEGFGICAWPSEQAALDDQTPKHFQRDAREHFLPFGELDEIDKLFVLAQVETLLEELLAIAEGASDKVAATSS